MEHHAEQPPFERRELAKAIDRAYSSNTPPAPAQCMDCGHPDTLDAEDNPETGA